MKEVSAVKYSVETARKLTIMWGSTMVMSLLILIINVMVMRAWWWLAYHGILLTFNAVMYRRAAVKLAEAKRLREREQWLEAMFTEWSR